MVRRRHYTGFSLLEVVIVVAIIAILAAIGIPRMSRGSKGAGDAALRADLTVLRNAIDLYAAEHQGNYPSTSGFADQLLKYTDEAGQAQTNRDETHYFGPYLRTIPKCPVGTKKGKNGVAEASGASDPNVGWVYNPTTGQILPNTGTLKDVAGELYTEYK